VSPSAWPPVTCQDFSAAGGSSHVGNLSVVEIIVGFGVYDCVPAIHGLHRLTG